MKHIFYVVLISTNMCHAITLKNVLKNPFSQEYQEVVTKEISCKEKNSLFIEHEAGDITVTTWKQPKIVIEATKIGDQALLKNCKIHTSQQDEKIRISSSIGEQTTINYHILVPESMAHLAIFSKNGNIKTKHIKCPISVSTENGAIDIINATNTVMAQSAKGAITIKQLHLEPDATVAIETGNGNVELFLATGINATLNLHTLKGTITTEQKVTLAEHKMFINEASWQALSKAFEAHIGLGGPSIKIKVAERGDIIIKEY